MLWIKNKMNLDINKKCVFIGYRVSAKKETAARSFMCMIKKNSLFAGFTMRMESVRKEKVVYISMSNLSMNSIKIIITVQILICK
jgi:hypothetical protein